ncbi:MAG: hypothetical protein ACAH17_01305 [Candidatus Paceibacterota bacterium]
MASQLIEVRVASFDQGSGQAKLIDARENDDVVTYDLWAPSTFGGSNNPYPHPGETLFIRYARIPKRIVECFRPNELKPTLA